MTACVGNGGLAASLPEDLWTYIFEAICFIHMKFMIKKDFPMNLHSTKRLLKHSTNFEHAENVATLNVVKCEC